MPRQFGLKATSSAARPASAASSRATPGRNEFGLCIEEPFAAKFRSVKALFPILGTAVLTCELAGLPWSAIHLGRLKIPATGKGNAKKPHIRQPDMLAAAKARWMSA